jgi:hypothetical protein
MEREAGRLQSRHGRRAWGESEDQKACSMRGVGMDGFLGCGWGRPLVARARAHDVKVKVKGVSMGNGNGIGDGTVHSGQASKSPAAKQNSLAAPGRERRGTASSTASCVVDGAAHVAASYSHGVRSPRTLVSTPLPRDVFEDPGRSSSQRPARGPLESFAQGMPWYREWGVGKSASGSSGPGC